MTDWQKLKVVDLRAELKQRGLSQTGLKPALVARLAEAENEEASESEATLQALENSSAPATSPDTISPVVASADGLPDAPLQKKPEVVETQPPAKNETGDTSQAQEEPEIKSPPGYEAHSSALPSVEPKEANEDQKKRKRRSQSPPPSATDSARKRFRPDDEIKAASVHSDGGLVEQHAVEEEGVKFAAEGLDSGSGSADNKPEDMKEDAKEELKHDVGVEQSGNVEMDMDIEMADSPEAEGALDHSTSRRDSRYKNLFPAATTTTTAAMGDIRKSEELEPERYVAPATHPATPALYIRDFMRPLNPASLHSHLSRLAAPPGHDDDPQVITDFYIDPIRTHAFVTFEKVSAAARVRSALHDRIWPDEKTRKPLWVDFVPAESIEQWVEREQSGGRGGKKWEVVYEKDEHQVVIATLQEAGSIPRSSQSARQPSAAHSSPHGVHPDRRYNVPTSPMRNRGQATAFSTGRERVDALFNRTTSKPVLYWQPVSKNVADRRLDSIDKALSKDGAAGRSLQGDFNRYTFEEDTVVDRGPEMFTGIRPPPGFRGPSGFGPRGGAAGGFQTRGGYPPPFRGGGRGYDSYRGGGGGSRGGDRWGVDYRRGERRDDRRDDRRDYGGRR